MVASHLQIWEWYRWRRRWGWKYTFNILCLLLPSTVNIVEWSLEYKDYKDHLIDQAALMLTLSGRVRETNQVLATQFSFRLRTPDLIIKVGQTIHQEHITSEKIKISIQIWFVFLLCSSLSQPIGKAVVGEKMAVEISFTNPLPQVLKAVIFHVEGLGLLPARKINYGWGGKIYFISCLFFLNSLVYLPPLWRPLSFPVLPSEILAAVPPCLWLSTSSPPCLGRGNYWLHWTASSSHRFMVWPTSRWRKKAQLLYSDLKTEALWHGIFYYFVQSFSPWRYWFHF